MPAVLAVAALAGRVWLKYSGCSWKSAPSSSRFGNGGAPPPPSEWKETPGVSYRSFKHLLGETSLERKCRFIFGGGIFVLVVFSFYWYGQKTESLVIEQTTQAARMLVYPKLVELHYKLLVNKDAGDVIEMFSGDFKPVDGLSPYEHEAHVLSVPKPAKMFTCEGK